MSVKVGHLFKKRTIRNLNGTIRYMEDESNGGVLIRNGQVINEERVAELAKMEEDKRTAATAFVNPVTAPAGTNIEERNVAPSKIEKLENEVTELKDNISQILALLQKPKRTKKK